VSQYKREPKSQRIERVSRRERPVIEKVPNHSMKREKSWAVKPEEGSEVNHQMMREFRKVDAREIRW
jgi:hypothetical protein